VTASDGAGLIAGRYRLVSEVGSGAMGVVWLARDERLGRTVAVKELRAGIGLSGTQVQRSHLRARREARIAARLHHPHAVAIFDVAEHDGRPYLVMEYVKSRSLAEVLADESRVLTLAEIAEIGAQLASALIAAHEAGIVHRDIKPGNILIAEDGKAKLTDFGISRANDDVTLTGTGEMLGTPAYVAPEVAQGRAAGTASDVFSLGATLYAAVEGVPPFGAGPTAMALLLRIVNGDMRAPERVGPLTETMMWMLRNNPVDRPTMAAVHRELQALAVSLVAPDANTTPIQVSPPTLPLPEADGGVVPSGAEGPVEAVESAVSAASAASADSAKAAKPAKVARSLKLPKPAKATKSAKSTGSAKAEARSEEASATPADAAPAAVAVPPAVAAPSAASAAPSAGGGAGASTGTPAKAAGSRRRPPLLWAAMAVAAVLAAGVAAIVATNGPSGSTTATSSTASPARAGHPSGPAFASSAASSSASTSPVGSTATTSVASSPSVSSTTASSKPADVAAQLKSAISDYYQLMPNHLDQAWGYLTADYQQHHAGGMSGYRSFWDQVQSVKVSDIVAQPPSTVTATIVYSYKNGSTAKERTSFGLVRSGGIWKIASSSVLSSQTE